MNRWFPLIGAIAAEVIATLSLKASLDNPAFYALVAIGYVSAFVLIARALKAGMSLGVAYGIWGASGVALTAVFSAIIYGEALTPMMIVGLVVIIAGVLTIEFGSQSAHKKQETKEAGA